MSTSAKGSPRDRLLDAATDLFYREGVGVGVEALCQAAGVSKRSMYKLFESKDEVLAATLERRAAAYLKAFESGQSAERSPRERILYAFERLEENSTSPDFWGCPFLAMQVELKNPEHPASRVAERVKQALTDYFRAEAERGGAADPELLARQLVLLFDGANARAGVRAETLAGLAVATASVLLDAAGISAEGTKGADG